MTINAASILRTLPLADEAVFSLLLEDGQPCKQVGIEELKILATAGHVCAKWRGGRIRYVQLVVAADVAFAEVRQIARRALGGSTSAANQTTQRASESLPGFVKRHHAAHCTAFARAREFFQPGGGPVDARYV